MTHSMNRGYMWPKRKLNGYVWFLSLPLFLHVTGRDIRCQTKIPIPRPIQNGAAKISGVVVGDDGKSVQARITALKSGLPVSGGRTDSAADGSFSFVGLVDGTYQLCAVDHAATYLDPCAWAAAPATVAISAKLPITGYKLVVIKGTPLPIRVNDPSQILDKPSATINQMPASLFVYVRTPRHTLQALPIMSKDSSGRNLQAAVPSTTPVSLALFGKGFTLADSSGNAVDVSGKTSIPVPIVSGQAITPITFAVKP